MLDNIKSALLSIWGNKLRSLLTLLGVVIGVSSVTTLVALGQGLKKDVAGLIQGFGTNVIVVLPGKIDTTKSNSATNPANFISGDVLTIDDVSTVAKIDGITEVAPLSLVAAPLKNGSVAASAPTIVGTTPNFLDALQVLKLGSGQMFTEPTGKEIVLAPDTKVELFGDADAVGKKVELGSEEFTVIGVFSHAEQTSSVFGSQFDSFTLIPFDEAAAFSKDQTKIMRIITKADDTAKVKDMKAAVKGAILTNHKGEEDFSVLTQDDILGLFDQFLNLATAMVSAIAAISLLVGGIGIMNIMLVTVTERTREIGLRKALGATQGAILSQFLTEAIVVTAVGGLLGLAVSLVTGVVVAANTPLKPSFSIEVVVVTVAISVAIGVIFGLWPPLRAARKDPIEALRYE
jgi:putative ABC transport system permease protein